MLNDERFAEMKEDISVMSGVEKILTFSTIPGYINNDKEMIYNLLLYTDNHQNYLPVPFLSTSKKETGALIPSSMEELLNGSDEFSFSITPEINLKFGVTGIIYTPSRIPTFGSSATGSIIAEYLYEENNRYILVSSFQGLEPYAITVPNMVIICSETANSSDRLILEQALQELGTVNSYEEFMENTKEFEHSQASELMGIPIFLLVICTISLLSLSIMLVYKKTPAIAVYLLCGCSKKRSVIYLAVDMLLVSLISGSINLIFFFWHDKLITLGLRFDKMIFSADILWLVLVYLILTIMLSILIPIFMIQSKTTMEICRGVEE